MKKVFSLLALSAAVMTMTTACSDNNDDNILDNNLSAKEEAISRAVVPYKPLPTHGKSRARAGNCQRHSSSVPLPITISTRISTHGLSTKTPWMTFWPKSAPARNIQSTTTSDMVCSVSIR